MALQAFRTFLRNFSYYFSRVSIQAPFSWFRGYQPIALQLRTGRIAYRQIALLISASIPYVELASLSRRPYSYSSLALSASRCAKSDRFLFRQTPRIRIVFLGLIVQFSRVILSIAPFLLVKWINSNLLGLNIALQAFIQLRQY